MVAVAEDSQLIRASERPYAQTENWIVVEALSKADAVEFGRTSWCTARSDGNHYERYYNTDCGRLFILYKKTKARPQYQVFKPKFGGIQFRDGGNLFVHEHSFLLENRELYDFFAEHDLISICETRVWGQTIFNRNNGPQPFDVSFVPSAVGTYPNMGVQGADGAMVLNRGPVRGRTVGTRDELPPTAQEGELMYAIEENSMYLFIGGGWKELDSVVWRPQRIHCEEPPRF